MFESTEQREGDQARADRKNGWLSELELEAIKREVEDESQGELCRVQDVTVGVETVETDVRTVEEEINDAEDSIGDTERNLSEKHQAIFEQLKTIMVEGRTGNSFIMFKKGDKKVLKVQTDRVDEAIKYLKNKNITETNNLIRAASVWVAERIALKKTEHRKKNESKWKGRIERERER